MLVGIDTILRDILRLKVNKHNTMIIDVGTSGQEVTPFYNL